MSTVQGAIAKPGAERSVVLNMPPVVEQVLAAGAFTAERFVANFAVIVQAAGGTKNLKALVLELAVRGRLSSRHPQDGTVADDLARIGKQRTEQAIKGGGGSANSDADEIDGVFEIPNAWRWVRWGDLVLSTDSGWSPQCENVPRAGDAWGVLKVSAVSWERFNGDENKALPSGVEPRVQCAAHAGDFLMSRANTAELVGRSVIVLTQPVKLLLSDKLVRCRFSKFTEQHYVNLFNRTTAARAHYLANASGTSDSMKNITRGVILSMPIPLPPLAEQKRIVARVDQRMPLIDELEAKQNRKHEVGARFTKASLEALTSAEGPQEFDAAWKRVRDNFGIVFERSETVRALREIVLDLATRGTLVPQVEAQGTGTNLLDRIVALRNKMLPASTTAETLGMAELATFHPVPASWCWTPLEVATDPIRRITYGILMPGPDRSQGPLYVKVRNMKNGVIDVASLPRTTPEIYAKYVRSALGKGDLLMSIRGSYGGVALVPDEIHGANITQDSARIAPLQGVDRNYLLLTLRSPLCQRYFSSIAKGAAVQGINIGDIRRTPVPLPPLAEQKRIVAKVEQLMKLCDELEAKLHRAEDRASRLVEAVVQEMVAY